MFFRNDQITSDKCQEHIQFLRRRADAADKAAEACYNSDMSRAVWFIQQRVRYEAEIEHELAR